MRESVKLTMVQTGWQQNVVGVAVQRGPGPATSKEERVAREEAFKKGMENLVKALWSLARAESVASAYASFSTPKPAATQVLTEPRSHIEAMHAPDRAEWIIAFDKEYHTLEGQRDSGFSGACSQIHT